MVYAVFSDGSLNQLKTRVNCMAISQLILVLLAMEINLPSCCPSILIARLFVGQLRALVTA